MKSCFWCIGKTDEKYIAEGIEEYRSRLKHYLSFEYTELNIKSTGKEGEAKEIKKLLKPNDTLVLLDEKGIEFSTVDFAGFLQKRFNDAGGRLIFLAGSAYGFSEELYSRANFKVALSKMTFTHNMVRLIFMEQLYRALTVLKGEKYHH